MLIEIEMPAPILNTSDYRYAFGGKSGNEIPLNERLQPGCFEFVALKGMVFRVEEIIEKKDAPIFKISCPFYSGPNLYLDSRFSKPFETTAPRILPSTQMIMKRMEEKIGTPYVWGGNWSEGIPQMLTYYPAKGRIDDRTYVLWTLKGVDCSGLLFEAADGATPRNTSELLHFGEAVPKGMNFHPLDMILYPGHVLFILNATTTIESKFPFGVICRNLEERLWELDQERTRVDHWTTDVNPRKNYIVRRFV